MLKSWALEAGFAEVNSSGDVWCYASDAEVAWWSDLWADRVMYSGFAGQAIERGVADRVDLQRMSDAWREWGTTPDAWCLIPHGEILARS